MGEQVEDTVTAFECGRCHKLQPILISVKDSGLGEINVKALFKCMEYQGTALMCSKCVTEFK